MSNCPYCNQNLDASIDVANHHRWCKSNPKNSKYLHGKTLNCIMCGIAKRSKTISKI